MSIRNKILAIAAVTALSAATAVPAMALENEFHGAFGVRGTTSNYNAYSNGNNGTGFLLDGVDSKRTNNFVDQRARIFYTAKANDSLKLVTGFELDSTWGKSSYALDRNNGGGALGADTTNLETKWVYLDFNIPSTPVNVKVGIQGLNDSYKALFVGGGADAAGVMVSAPVGPVTLSGGWFRLDDRTIGAASAAQATTATFSDGKLTRDLILLDAKVAITKDAKIGASYYFLNDDNAPNAGNQSIAGSLGPFGGATGTASDYAIHVLGVNGAATFGPATIDGFFLYEFGSLRTFNSVAVSQHVNAFAGNLGAKVKAGPATLKANALYVSGSNLAGGGNNLGNGFISVNNTTSGAFCENALGGAFGNMFLLVRNPGPGQSTNDQAIAYDSSNREMGIMGGSIGADINATDKLFVNVNLGYLATAKNQGRNKSQGTEGNLEVGYKLYDNMTASVQGAYVLLGDFYKHTAAEQRDPANPYLTRIVLNYTF